MEQRIQPLPIDPAKLNGLSEKLLVSHHQNNYPDNFLITHIVEYLWFLFVDKTYNILQWLHKEQSFLQK